MWFFPHGSIPVFFAMRVLLRLWFPVCVSDLAQGSRRVTVADIVILIPFFEAVKCIFGNNPGNPAIF